MHSIIFSINFTEILSIGFIQEFPLDFFVVVVKFFYASDSYKLENIIVLLKICFLFQLIAILIILSFFSAIFGFILLSLKFDPLLFSFQAFLFLNMSI